jgi:hypothetical protein
MKTIKKAAIALIFLAPLFLPAETKAGGFDDWFRNFIQERRGENHPVAPVANDRYRSYNPYAPHGRPGSGSATGSGGGNSVPIDGGLVFLLGAGLLFGAKTIYDRKRSVAVVSR